MIERQLNRSVRTALEHDGIGWCVGDYNDDFGLVVGQYDQPRQIDKPIAEALGLTQSIQGATP